MECCFAADDAAAAEEFWVSRMNLILELSDILLLLDVERSANVDFEFHISQSISRTGKALFYRFRL